MQGDSGHLCCRRGTHGDGRGPACSPTASWLPAPIPSEVEQPGRGPGPQAHQPEPATLAKPRELRSPGCHCIPTPALQAPLPPSHLLAQPAGPQKPGPQGQQALLWAVFGLWGSQREPRGKPRHRELGPAQKSRFRHKHVRKHNQKPRRHPAQAGN